MDMPFVRRWLSRGLDGLAIVVVLYALFHFFVQPRLIREAAEPAPPVALAALDGGRFSLAEHRGRVVFLDFWASWCAPCKQSLPLVEHYARAHPDIVVVAVNVGESAAAARAYARQTRLANVVLDPDEIAAHAYGVNGFPTMVVVDPAGMVRAKWIGYNPAVEQAMADARRRYGKVARATAPWGVVPAEAATLRPLTLAIEDDPNSLDTIRNTPFGWQLGPLTQGYLFLVDDRGALVPDRALAVPSAANGGISADGRTITYRIRTGQWSDGARNQHYWRGPARSAALTVAIVPDAATRLLVARTGEVDVIEVAGLDVDAARAVPTLHLRATTTNIVDYLQFNLHSPLLRDPGLRRAIALAVDRRSLAAKVYRSSSSLPTACNPIRAIARRKRCRPSTRPPRGA